MKSADFLDLLQRHFGVDSDNKLARCLRWDRVRISKYRTGRREFDDATCAEVADILDLAPAYVMAQIAAERADCTRVREVWQSLARMLEHAGPSKAALVLVCVLFGSMASDFAYGMQTAADCILRKIARGRVFARLRGLLARPERPACTHPRAVPSRIVPAYTCPDCGAVFRLRTATRSTVRRRRRWYRPTMAVKFAAAVVLPILGACSTWDALPASERAWQSLHLIDIAQTLNGPASDPCYFERTWTRHIIGEKPEPAAVIAWGVGLAIAHYAASRWLERAELPRGLELAMRSIDLSYKGLTVADNHARGVRPFGANSCPWR